MATLQTIDADVRAVRLFRDGVPVRGDFTCADCSYGVHVIRALPRCPMCGSTLWEPAVGRRGGITPLYGAVSRDGR